MNNPTFYIGSNSKRLDFAARVTPAFKQHHTLNGAYNSIANRNYIEEVQMSDSSTQNLPSDSMASPLVFKDPKEY